MQAARYGPRGLLSLLIKFNTNIAHLGDVPYLTILYAASCAHIVPENIRAS
jgi:hypothetical protein